MNVIFLDFDGVLVNRASWSVRSGGHATADPICVGALNRIVKATGAEIVVSSTWRLGTPLYEIRGILSSWGVKGNVIGITPRIIEKNGRIVISRPRGDEIKEWLEVCGARFGVERFVILDDESDMGELTDRLVKCEFETGLTEDGAERAIELLKEGSKHE